MFRAKPRLKFLIICFFVILLIIGTLIFFIYIKHRESVINQDLSSWIGQYTFNEFYKPNINMNYQLTIEKADNEYYGVLNVDGFQTLISTRLSIKGGKDKISLFMEDYLPDNINKVHNKGEKLFSLKKVNDHIITEWGAIEPIALKNNKTGYTGFKKTK